MSGCDMSSFGGGYQSKRNKQSQPIDVRALGNVLSYNVKDANGKLVTSRNFKIGEYAIIAWELPLGKEITAERAAELTGMSAEDSKSVVCGEITGFWTCLDGRNSDAEGAEIKGAYGNRRLPLRVLLPMPNPKPKRPTDTTGTVKERT